MKHFEKLQESNKFVVVTYVPYERRLCFIRSNLTTTFLVDKAYTFRSIEAARVFGKKHNGIGCNLSELVISTAPIAHLKIGAIVFLDTGLILERQYEMVQLELSDKVRAAQFEHLEKQLRYSLPYRDLSVVQKNNYFKFIHKSIEDNQPNPIEWVTGQLKEIA